MIAQPILTTPSAAKVAASAEPPPVANGFLDLLTSSTSLGTPSPATGGSFAPIANKISAKTASNDTGGNNPSGAPIPYIHVPTPPTTPQAQGEAAGGATNAASALATAAAGLQQGQTQSGNAPDAAVPGAGSGDGSANAQTAAAPNSSNAPFGAAELNARIAAGAPLYASQPTAAMAPVPAHLLEAVDPHTGAAPDAGSQGTTGSAGSKSSSSAATAPSAVPASAAAAPSLPQMPAGHGVVPPTPAVAANDSNQSQPDSSDQSGDDDSAAAAATASAQAQAPTQLSAPVQVDAAVHTVAPYIPVGEQVAINLRQAIDANSNEIHIALKPASLGAIDVKLNVGHDGHISAVISADRSDTLNMLKQDSGTLQQALKDAGLNADSSSLSFNLRGDAQSFGQNAWQGGGTGSGGGQASPAIEDTVSPSPVARRSHAGALNIEV